MIESGSQGIKITAFIGSDATYLFQGRIVGRVAMQSALYMASLQSGAQCAAFRKAKIEQNNISILVDAYAKLMKRKVVFHNTDKVGMVVYNCSGIASEKGMIEGVEVIDPLDLVSAEKILNAPGLQTALTKSALKVKPKSNQHIVT